MRFWFYNTKTKVDPKCIELDKRVLDICHEFGHGDDANAWRKSNKEADKDKFFISF